VFILSLQHPKNPCDRRISSIIYDIIGFLLASISLSAKKVNRNANFCTHLVAHWAVERYFSSSILTAPPTPSIPIVSEKDPPIRLLGI
jgi:hypothetical protein